MTEEQKKEEYKKLCDEYLKAVRSLTEIFFKTKALIENK